LLFVLNEFSATLTYHSTNLDTFSAPYSFAVGKAVMELRNETLFTAVLPYAPSPSATDQEHDAMHSSRLNSNANYPHSFLSTPIHEIPNDTDSKIVGNLGGLFAWDYALRNLLPNNVNGIIVEIRNTCNQSSTYALVGYDAFYLGDNATSDAMYDDMEVVRDLSFSTNPNFNTTLGHCRYTIVSETFVLLCYTKIFRFSYYFISLSLG
jgi:hypothetical protein